MAFAMKWQILSDKVLHIAGGAGTRWFPLTSIRGVLAGPARGTTDAWEAMVMLHDDYSVTVVQDSDRAKVEAAAAELASAIFRLSSGGDQQ